MGLCLLSSLTLEISLTPRSLQWYSFAGTVCINISDQAKQNLVQMLLPHFFGDQAVLWGEQRDVHDHIRPLVGDDGGEARDQRPSWSPPPP